MNHALAIKSSVRDKCFIRAWEGESLLLAAAVAWLTYPCQKARNSASSSACSIHTGSSSQPMDNLGTQQSTECTFSWEELRCSMVRARPAQFCHILQKAAWRRSGAVTVCFLLPFWLRGKLLLNVLLGLVKWIYSERCKQLSRVAALSELVSFKRHLVILFFGASGRTSQKGN